MTYEEKKAKVASDKEICFEDVLASWYAEELEKAWAALEWIERSEILEDTIDGKDKWSVLDQLRKRAKAALNT